MVVFSFNKILELSKEAELLSKRSIDLVLDMLGETYKVVVESIFISKSKLIEFPVDSVLELDSEFVLVFPLGSKLILFILFLFSEIALEK